MSVFPNSETSDVFADAAKRGVWQRLSQAVDVYCVRRSKRAVPDIALRRSKCEMVRCRRLVRDPPRYASRTALAVGAPRYSGRSQ
jgi:hypothetical protein